MGKKKTYERAVMRDDLEQEKKSKTKRKTYHSDYDYDSDSDSDSDEDQMINNARHSRVLENKLRVAQNHNQRMVKRFKVVQQENLLHRRQSEELLRGMSEMKQELKKKSELFEKWTMSEEKYKKVIQAMQLKLGAVEKLLVQSKAREKKAKDKLKAQPPSVLKRLETEKKKN